MTTTTITVDLPFAARIERDVRKVAKVRSVQLRTDAAGVNVITSEVDSEADIFPALGYSTGRDVEYVGSLMVTVTEWSLFGSTRVEVTATTELTWDHIHHDEVRGMPSVQALRELGWGDDL